RVRGRRGAVDGLRGLELRRRGELDVAFELGVDFRTVRVADRQLVGGLPLHAGHPAEAGVVARYLGKTVEALRHAARCRRKTGAGHDGAEVDRVRQGHVGAFVDETEADREAVVHLERGRQGEVDGLEVRLDGVVAANPITVVFGLQAERRTDAGAEGQAFQRTVHREHRRQVRHGRRFARVAAITARERGTGTGGAAAVEAERHVDDRHVGLHGVLVQIHHRRRVVADHRGVVAGGGHAGLATAEVLDAGLAQLEAARLGLAHRQHAGNAKRQRAESGAIYMIHVCTLSDGLRVLSLLLGRLRGAGRAVAVTRRDPSRRTTPYAL